MNSQISGGRSGLDFTVGDSFDLGNETATHKLGGLGLILLCVGVLVLVAVHVKKKLPEITEITVLDPVIISLHWRYLQSRFHSSNSDTVSLFIE